MSVVGLILGLNLVAAVLAAREWRRTGDHGALIGLVACSAVFGTGVVLRVWPLVTAVQP